MRNRVLALSDQLDRRPAAFCDFDSDPDTVWMAKVEEEAAHVWCQKLRLAAFFSTMRHFRDELRQHFSEVLYSEFSHRRTDDRGSIFARLLRKAINKNHPERTSSTHFP